MLCHICMLPVHHVAAAAKLVCCRQALQHHIQRRTAAVAGREAHSRAGLPAMVHTAPSNTSQHRTMASVVQDNLQLQPAMTVLLRPLLNNPAAAPAAVVHHHHSSSLHLHQTPSNHPKPPKHKVLYQQPSHPHPQQRYHLHIKPPNNQQQQLQHQYQGQHQPSRHLRSMQCCSTRPTASAGCGCC